MGISFPSAGGSFADPGRSFANLEAALVANLVTASTDIAMLIDGSGTITDVALSDEALLGPVQKSWIGSRFIDVVTVESRRKVEKLLAESKGIEIGSRREVNHPIPGNDDLPISYSVLTLSPDGQRLALGRDLRAIALLQQKLVETQLSMESDYARLRNAEAQYRVLFDTANEAIVIVDAANRKVLEANTVARRTIEPDGRRILGAELENLFAARSRRDLEELIAATRASGESESADLVLSGGDKSIPVIANFYRQQGATRISLRFGRTAQGRLDPGSHDLIAKAGRELPDAIVVTNADLEVVAANESFLDLAEIATSGQATGRSFGEMIGRRGVEMGLVKTAVDTNGTVRNFSTVMSTAFGASVDIELSGTAMNEGGTRFYGFSLRRVSRSQPTSSAAEPLRSANDMTGLVGRVPLRDIVRETVDIIEQLCIEAALDLTRNNRASASEMLGLSRQSLYSKLRRYNIGDLTAEDADDSASN